MILHHVPGKISTSVKLVLSRMHLPKISPNFSVEPAKLTTVPFKVASAMHPTNGADDATVPDLGVMLRGKPPIYKSPCIICKDGGAESVLQSNSKVKQRECTNFIQSDTQ